MHANTPPIDPPNDGAAATEANCYHAEPVRPDLAPDPVGPGAQAPVPDEAVSGEYTPAVPPPALLLDGNRPAARFLALMEMIFISGIFTDAVAAALAAWALGVTHGELVRRPSGLLVFLLGSTLFVTGLYVLFQSMPRGTDVRIRICPERHPWRELLVVLGSLPVLFGTMWVAELAVRRLAPGAFPAENPVLGLIQTPADLACFFISGTIGGGLREELQRAFIVRRSEVYFWSPWYGLIVWSIVFGLAHAAQGPVAIIVTALLGLEFGLLYLWRRNLLVTVTSHALFNVVVLSIYGSSIF